MHGLPRNTFTYLVEGFLAADQTSLRNQVLCRYPGFYRSLLNSPSREVRILVRLVSNDPKSTTCRNLKHLARITCLEKPQLYCSWRIREVLPVQYVPKEEEWRLGLLSALMKVKRERYSMVKDMQQICAMLDSLAST